MKNLEKIVGKIRALNFTVKELPDVTYRIIEKKEELNLLKEMLSTDGVIEIYKVNGNSILAYLVKKDGRDHSLLLTDLSKVYQVILNKKNNLKVLYGLLGIVGNKQKQIL